MIKVLLAYDKISDGTYNLCSGYPITIKELYRKIGEHLRSDKPVNQVTGKLEYSLGDNFKLRSLCFEFRPFSISS